MSAQATVVTRTLASIPTRSATETWDLIVDLVAPNPNSAARRELHAVAGIACSCIADEALRYDPLVVWGTGPRVRVYCLYDDAAVEGDGVNESSLSFVPTDGEWQMSLPCTSEDFGWVQRSLGRVSTRVTARVFGDDVAEMSDATKAQAALSIVTPTINLDAFLR